MWTSLAIRMIAPLRAKGRPVMRNATTGNPGFFIALMLACLAGAPDNAAAATTRTVTSLNDDGGPTTLRTLIGASADGDTINFSVTGTITLTKGPLTNYNSITIIGPSSANLTISGNNATSVFDINAGTTNSISGLTIANGYSTLNGRSKKGLEPS